MIHIIHIVIIVNLDGFIVIIIIYMDDALIILPSEVPARRCALWSGVRGSRRRGRRGGGSLGSEGARDFWVFKEEVDRGHHVALGHGQAAGGDFVVGARDGHELGDRIVSHLGGCRCAFRAVLFLSRNGLGQLKWVGSRCVPEMIKLTEDWMTSAVVSAGGIRGWGVFVMGTRGRRKEREVQGQK